MDTVELRRQRAKLVADGRALLDKARAEKRDLTSEELAQHDAMLADVDKLKKVIDTEERQAELDREMTENLNTADKLKGQPGGHDESNEKREERKMASFNRYLQAGPQGLTPEDVRALEVTDLTKGGYLQAPQRFVASLLQNIDDAIVVRQLATTYQLGSAESLGVPTLGTDLGDGDWNTELGDATEDTALRIGKRELRPHPITKLVKVSNTLMRVSILDPEVLVRQRLAYRFALTMEKGYLTGNGASQPLGLFTASADGISTSRDVSTGNTATTIQADNLKEVKYTLKSQYWGRARWLFHRDAMKMIDKMIDGTGQYLWQPGLQAGAPDRLLGFPIVISENVPNTFTTLLYVGMLGDFSYYWIADALDMQVSRLVELYAVSNQTGIIARMESDGMPVLEEAFVRVKLG
jgi:HK97 family phage major capsid protein